MSSANPPAGPLSPRPSLRRSAAALAQDHGRLGWAPIVAALAIDMADIVSAGPHGLVIGAVLTTVVARASGARWRRSFVLGLFGAVYLALPLTEPIPLATMLTLVHGFMLRKRHAAAETEQAQPKAQMGAQPLSAA